LFSLFFSTIHLHTLRLPIQSVTFMLARYKNYYFSDKLHLFAKQFISQESIFCVSIASTITLETLRLIH